MIIFMDGRVELVVVGRFLASECILSMESFLIPHSLIVFVVCCPSCLDGFGVLGHVV